MLTEQSAASSVNLTGVSNLSSPSAGSSASSQINFRRKYEYGEVSQNPCLGRGLITKTRMDSKSVTPCHLDSYDPLIPAKKIVNAVSVPKTPRSRSGASSHHKMVAIGGRDSCVEIVMLGSIFTVGMITTFPLLIFEIPCFS